MIFKDENKHVNWEPFDSFDWSGDTEEHETNRMNYMTEISTQLNKIFGLNKVYDEDEVKASDRVFGLNDQFKLYDLQGLEDLKKNFSLDRNQLSSSMGIMPKELNGIIDTLIALNKNIFSLKDLIFCVELKKAGEAIRHNEAEWQLLLLQVLFSLCGNERNPIVFQTHLIEDNKKVGDKIAANWAYYFVKNEDSSNNNDSSDNRISVDNDADGKHYAFVRHRLSSRKFLYWIFVSTGSPL